MKNTKWVLLIVISILLISTVSAIDFRADVVSTKSEIYLDESAEFELTITNLRDISDVYQAYSSDIGWYVSTSEPIGRLEPGETKNITFTLTPNAWATIGPQKVTFIIRSRNDDTKQTHELAVFVRPWDFIGRDYLPSFELKLDIPNKIDPRTGNIPVEIYIRNRNRLNAENIFITLNSDFFYKEVSIPIGPLEEISQEYDFKIDPVSAPQDTEVDAVVYYNNNSVSTKKKTISIIPYSDIIKTEETNQYFFKTTKTIQLKNDGNIISDEKYSVPMKFWEYLFSKSDVTPIKEKDNGKRYFSWQTTLEPQETKIITIYTNYRLIPYLIFIISLSLILYYINRSPIVGKKDALIISTPSGGISELKIILHVKNRTQDTINNVHVTDKIPKLADLVNESSIGTIEPTKILKNERKGTLIKWEIQSLEPYEERVITYRTRSRLNIIGGIVLPSYKVKFDGKNNKERIIYSNKCEVKIDY